MYAHAAVKMLRALNDRFADYDPANDAMITHGTVRYPIPGVYTEKQAGVHISIIYGDYFFTEGILKLLGSDYFAW
jgi:unsaturated chondroitin disaccharide hydrolase